jgi:hypothetical protein
MPTNIIPIKRVHPKITGKSRFERASIESLPIPLQLKIYSMKKAPANNEANHPIMLVVMGFIAFRRAWMKIIFVSEMPLAWAVRI